MTTTEQKDRARRTLSAAMKHARDTARAAGYHDDAEALTKEIERIYKMWGWS